METVLGLTVTATRVQTVLVEGRDATGATLEQDDFAVFTPDVSVGDACERVAAEVRSIAAADGHRLHAVAVTWTEDADLEAALVLDALAASGIEAAAPVIAIGARHSAEALAHSIGTVVGYRRAAVCVVEPESVLLSLIDTATGDGATSSAGSIRSADALAEWLGSVFSDADWHPEGVFLVGSIGGLPALAEGLSAELGVPVFDPPGAELALAHGAALAAGTDPVFRPGAVAPARLAPLSSTKPAARRTAALPLTMMTAGAAAIVVSTSLLVSPALLPDRPPLAAREVVQFAGAGTAPPAAVPAPPADPAPPAAVPVTAPEPAEAVAPEPPVADVPVDVPTPDAQFVVDVVPEAPAPVAAPVEPAAELPAPAPVVLPPPPVVAPPVPAVPDTQPRLRDRIRDRIDSGLNRIVMGN